LCHSKLLQALDKSTGESALVDLLPDTAGAGHREGAGKQAQRQQARTGNWYCWSCSNGRDYADGRRDRTSRQLEQMRARSVCGRLGAGGLRAFLKTPSGSDQRPNFQRKAGKLATEDDLISRSTELLLALLVLLGVHVPFPASSHPQAERMIIVLTNTKPALLSSIDVARVQLPGTTLAGCGSGRKSQLCSALFINVPCWVQNYMYAHHEPHGFCQDSAREISSHTRAVTAREA